MASIEEIMQEPWQQVHPAPAEDIIESIVIVVSVRVPHPDPNEP